MLKFRWEHVFPDRVRRAVVLQVLPNLTDLEAALIRVRYEKTGGMLEERDYRHLVSDLGKSIETVRGRGVSIAEVLNLMGKTIK